MVEMSEDDGRRRVSRMIRERRDLLGYTQESLAAAAGVSVSTVKSLESWTGQDRGFASKSLRAIEDALHWGRLSIDRIEEGEDPDELLATGDVPIPGMPFATGERAGHGGGRYYTVFTPKRRVQIAAAEVEAALDAKPRWILDEVLWRELIDLALIEERHVTDVLRDAIDLYKRTLGPRSEVDS
jgi:hypothetical protein